jgi:Trp operon repressor
MYQELMAILNMIITTTRAVAAAAGVTIITITRGVTTVTQVTPEVT